LLGYGSQQWRLLRFCAHTPARRNLPAATNRRLPTATNSHFRLTKNSRWFSLYSIGTDPIENNASNNFFVVAWLFVTAEKCLPCRCLAMDVFSGSALPAFIRHVTIHIYVYNLHMRYLHRRQMTTGIYSDVTFTNVIILSLQTAEELICKHFKACVRGDAFVWYYENRPYSGMKGTITITAARIKLSYCLYANIDRLLLSIRWRIFKVYGDVLIQLQWNSDPEQWFVRLSVWELLFYELLFFAHRLENNIWTRNHLKKKD
jgi:uncharacterized Fe-S cluster protein YjdI